MARETIRGNGPGEVAGLIPATFGGAGQLCLDGRVWVARVTPATRLFDRMRGLLGRRSLPPGEGLLIVSCGSIHTVGMRFAIDALFLDRLWRVCRVCRNLRPGLPMVWGGWRAVYALEVSAGWVDWGAIPPSARFEWRSDS